MIGEATSRERIALDGADRTPPSEFRIFKFGKIETTKGTFLFDEKAAASVMAAWKSYGNDLSIDWEHKMVDPNAGPGEGKAAGWFRLALRDDGLYAVGVKWTDEGANALQKAHFRYYSPTFDFDRKTGRVLELVNVALTNIPATKNLPALVAANRRKQMPKKDETATEELGVKKTKKTVTETTEDDAATDADDGDAATDADDDSAATDGDDGDVATDSDDGDASTDDTDLDEESSDEADTDDDGDDDDGPPPKKKAPPPPPPKQTSRVAVGKTSASDRTPLNRMSLAQVRAAVRAEIRAELSEADRKGKILGVVRAAIKDRRITPAQKDFYVQAGMSLGLGVVRKQLSLLSPMLGGKATEPDHSGPIARLSKEQVQTFARANGMAYKDALRAPELVELAKSLRPIVTVQHPGAADDADAAE